MNPVNWFEIAVNDLGRAKAFYEAVLGVEFMHMEMGPAKMEMFPFNPEAPGAAGALIQTDGYTPSHEGAVIYFSVDDIEATLKKVGGKGGKTLQEKMEIGATGTSVLGVSSSAQGGVGLDTMVQRLVQKSVWEIDSKYK